MQTGRRFLKSLEKTNLFVFHGSKRKLVTLEPRQQLNYSHKLRRLVKDGRPAVCVTQYADTAIFRALIQGGGWTSFGTTNGKMILRSSQEALQHAKKHKSHGYVYAFLKANFKKHSPFELRSYKKQSSLIIVPVTLNDAPKVRIIKNWRRWQAQKRYQV